MAYEVQTSNLYLKPGHVFLPAEPTQIWSVAASGIAVLIFDQRQKRGGMAHYSRPYREKGISTAIYAAPAIVALVQMFRESGSSDKDLEAQIYGGSVNPSAPNYEKGLDEDNAKVGFELLRKMGLPIIGRDVGGPRARKIVFQSGTGETLVAKVDRVRESDWYPGAAPRN
ncbi:MAG: chemotaxis protein CheD [Proteobacteria bacterium]|nr:chemotaxis protein CheD [Pseudomonadota bacterium]